MQQKVQSLEQSRAAEAQKAVEATKALEASALKERELRERIDSATLNAQQAVQREMEHLKVTRNSLERTWPN